LQQLQYNGSADIGHDPDCKYGHSANILAGEHIDKSKECILGRLEKLLQRFDINTRGIDLGTHPVNGQQ
jgi:hypothetical protein